MVSIHIGGNKGSHKFLQRSDGRCTVVSVHTDETIGRGLLAQIMRDREITSEDLKKIYTPISG